MTHLKKSLAMLLALVMMFSSMSVAASAWTVNDDPDDISFTVKFFRESPAGSDNWIETENAAPGEKVKARIYIETGYYTYGGETAFIFDRDFFNVTGLDDGVRTSLEVNQSYAGPSDDVYGAGEYNLAADATWRATTDYDSWFNEWNKHFYMDYIVEEIENDADFFKVHDFISSNIEFGSTINNSKLADDDWMYEFELVVADNTVTNTVDETGEAEVPPYYYSKDRYLTDENGEYLEDVELPINVSKGENGKYRNKNRGMWDWYPEFATTPGVLSTTSEIIFDMGLVDANGAWYEDTYTTVDGIISKEADLNAITNPVHPDGSLVFSHWSTQKPGEGAAQEKVSTIAYDYDALTLYAVWTEAPDVSYTLKEFYMNADGSYPTDVEGVKKEAAPNSTVSAPESTDPLYTLNAELSSKDVVINADSSSVVNAYYERNKYNLVYHYEDNTGSVTDRYTVRFGAELPAFEANPSGQPDRVGYTFLGWATEEGGEPLVTLPSVMPTEDLHLYAVYEPIAIDFIFNAGEGTFADGESVKRYSYKYGEATVAPEVPTALGKTFVVWDDDIPATAYETKTFEAIYEDTLYIVTFRADTDKDGEYETIVAEEEYVYGEKLYPEEAPENYPIDAWKLEDGTAVVISEDEEVAYTVTEDVVFYTVGSDEYPARFYWSEEDMENGAEPYTTVYVKYKNSITAPTDPSNPGYTFIAWEPDAKSGLIMDSTDGKDFYAIFEANEIIVTYDPNNGVCDAEPGKATYGESVTLPEATRDGYEFLGWVNPDGENVGKAGEEYAVPTENVTLKADWKAEKHTITFVNTGDTVIPAIEADTDAEIEAPAEPSKKGHEFTGWINEAGEAAEVPATMPAEDMVLTATWNKLSYELNADANGGKFSDGSNAVDTEIPYGDELKVEEPTWEGHEFLGWANADDDSNTIITLPETMPDEAINIKAVWDTNKHDVKYDANGGVFTNADGSTTSLREFKDVEYGAQVPTLEEIPVREGYTFIRWTPEKPDAMIDDDLTFTAEWKKDSEPEAVEYEIYVSYPNPANPEEKIEKLVITDSALPKTTVEVIKAGEDKTADKAHTYEEILANVKVNGIEPDYNNRPAPITVTENGGKLVVEFKLTTYTVTFNPNGGKFGESVKPIVTGTWGQAVEAPADPTRTGYTFKGWDAEVPETFTEDVVLNAIWEIQSHKAIFVVVDENGNEVARISEEYNYGETIVAPGYSAPAGYDFAGWDVPAGTTMGEEDVTFTSTLVSKYYSLSYKISGLPADKGVSAPATQSGIRANAEVSVSAAPEVDGYTFDGWYDGRTKYAADGSDKIVFAAKNITLEGVYSANRYSITFNTNGAAEDVETAYYNCDELVETLPTVTREGYEFLGWYEGETKAEAGFKMPANNINLKAEWEKKETPKYTITYLDGSEILNEVTYEAGAVIEEYIPDAKPGYTFIGWEPSVPTSMPANDVTVTAVWETNKHSVTYDAGEGIFADEAGAPSKITYNNIAYGTAVPAPETEPSREGYTFLRWTPAKPDAMPDEDLIFTAEWERIPDPEEVTYEVYVAYPNPANPEETIEKLVITDSALPGTTVEILKAGEEKTADKAHTYDEIIAQVDANGVEPDYDNRPETAVIGENTKIVVNFKLTEFVVTFNGNEGFIFDDEEVGHSEVVFKGYLGQQFEIPGDDRLERKGYDFTGWDKEPSNTFSENVTYNATWALQVHDVYFYVMNEEGEEVFVKVESFEYGEEIVAPEYTAPEGYEFSGWDIGDDVMGEEDLSYIATVTPIGFKLSYELIGLPEDKDVVAPETQTGLHAGKEAPIAAAPEVPGYEIEVWVDADGNEYTADGNDSITMPAEDVVLYGTYTAKEYKIRFNSNGAGSVPNATYKCDETVETLPVVSKDGYTFLGWYEGETKVEAGFKMPARDMNLEAKWEEKVVGTSIITLDANGGKFANGAPVYPVKAEIGVPFNAVPENPTREGYDFVGWTDVDGNPTTIPEVFPPEDVTIKAQWEPKEYTITFDSNGGSEVASQTYKFGDEVIAPADPTREGFKFIKWNPELPETMPANDITVVAEWEALVVTKTLTIDANGGTFEDGSSVKEETLAVGEEIKDLPVPTRDGYTFEGWTGIPEDGKMPAEDITISAEWAPVVIPEHNVEYYYAVGGELYDTLTFKEGEAIVHPEGPEVEGLTFKGWTDENGNELPAVMGNEDIKAYAKFDVNNYKVTYIVDGSVYMEYEVPYQAEVPVPEDPKDSATRLFAGWEPTVEDIMPAHDLTYTATWVGAPEPDEYTATFLRHNGETHAKYVLEEGDIIPIPVAPERFGYVFVGWEPAVPETMPAQDMVFEPKYEIDKTFVTIVIGGGVVIAGGAIAGSIIGANAAAITGVSIVGGILVIVGVAELIKHTHTVTYLVDGEVYKTYKVVEGTKIPVPSDPVKDGFKFEDWNPEVPKKMGNEDLVFEATWSENAVQGDGSTDAEVDVEIPATGSVAGGLTAFAVISGAAAAAYVITRRKKED